MDLHKEAKDTLRNYWHRHPEAYLKFRDEQIARCKDAKGRVLKQHRHAHDYYVTEKLIFEYTLTGRLPNAIRKDRT